MNTGWKTTEFWLTLAVVVLGAALELHVLPDGSWAERMATLAMTVLAAMGYTWRRTALKLKLQAIRTPGDDEPPPPPPPPPPSSGARHAA